MRSADLAKEPESIFTVDAVQFQFAGSMAAMQVSSNILLMALDNYRLKRIDLQQAKQVEGINY